MLFNSYPFLFYYLPITFAVYFLTPVSYKNFVLTLSSYVFYGYWNVYLCGLLLLSTGINYWLGHQIFISVQHSDRRNYLILVVIINLGLLGFFKYANFFIDSLQMIFPFFSMKTMQIVLPIGISFFTFQGLSYSFDLYKKQAEPVRSFIDFACYISMFPQLVAGPIVRFSEIAEQLISREHSLKKIAYGVRRFIIGLAKKVLIADTLAYICSQQLYLDSATGVNIWIGITAFSLQIYYDFSGYSDMAIGLGHILGFSLPENFNSPYRAKGIYDFWRRWHMTLSGWLRDYVYIPLGGAHCSRTRWALNIMTTFLLCGLWHGAAWNYVVWGGYYGVVIIVERPFRGFIEKMPSWLVIPSTNIVVVIGWIFFKADNLKQSAVWLEQMFGFSRQNFLNLPSLFFLIFLVVVQLSCWSGHFKMHRVFEGTSWGDPLLIVVFFMCVVAILGVEVSPFLYYQF